MLDYRSFCDVYYGLFSIIAEVFIFWKLRFKTWWSQKSQQDALVDALAESKSFEQWEAAAFQLDEMVGNDLWRQNPTSKYYDYRLIYERLQAIIETREEEDILGLVNLLRSGLVRNLGNITAPRLFNRAYAGTKLLIEDYITQVALAIGYVASNPTDPAITTGLNSQAKLDLLHDTRQAFGRSALVLQGGAIFGLCHIGVVKALHLRGLLPRIIAGTAAGALVAAMVGVRTEDELLRFLNGESIDLSAFGSRQKPNVGRLQSHDRDSGCLSMVLRRVKRYCKEGYVLDVHVLEECVRANVGDMTFEEAYNRTKRVLNITLPTVDGGDFPSLVNYLTGPNVLIWSAAIASNASSAPLYEPVTLLCKDALGNVNAWSSRPNSPATNKPISPIQHQVWANSEVEHTGDIRDSPLSRVAELFNVNHFVVSQARPSIAPFLQTSDVLSHALPRHSTARRKGIFWHPLRRLIVLECQHRLKQMDTLGLLPTSIRRLVLDENIPGASLTIVPELRAADFLRLLERPTERSIDEWILRGERSVWPAVGALKVRCAVELELDRAYQIVRRRKPMDAVALPSHSGSHAAQAKMMYESPSNGHGQGHHLKGSGEKRRRERASSVGDDTKATGKTPACV